MNYIDIIERYEQYVEEQEFRIDKGEIEEEHIMSYEEFESGFYGEY